MISAIGVGCPFPSISALRAAGTPSLLLDFINPTLDPRITFSRSSGGTCVNSAGLIETIAANIPRFDYDPVTLAPRGLLIEESRVNRLLQSNTFTVTWAQTNIASNAKTQVGIDGTANSATLITEGTLLTAVTQQAISGVTAGETGTFSLYIKSASCPFIRFSLYSFANNTNFVRAWLNTATGQISSSVAGGTGSGATATASAGPNGFTRITVTGAIAAVSDYYCTFGSASADGVTTRVSGSTYIVDAAQYESGAFPTSYIPTTTATVTRAADVASMTGTNFSSWFNATEGTFVASADSYGRAVGTYPNVISASIVGASTDRISLYFNANTSVCGEIRVANVGVASQAITHSGSAAVRMVTAYKVGSSNSAADGIVDVADAPASLPTVTGLAVGSSAVGGSANLNGHLQRIAYFNKRLPDNTLKALSA